MNKRFHHFQQKSARLTHITLTSFTFEDVSTYFYFYSTITRNEISKKKSVQYCL